MSPAISEDCCSACTYVTVGQQVHGAFLGFAQGCPCAFDLCSPPPFRHTDVGCRRILGGVEQDLDGSNAAFIVPTVVFEAFQFAL
ncbi:hypothetical protein MPSYJ_55530 [Mycolicibacterium psychrotolerans]|uniref:Uncharacterized protein n=1 Tax=Mycolicibacterium psychrotolerans TaxID=216929 RepID=A0A7I7MJR7_9MYCO|nr:hypothetical protein MPSYJ_55530 [Mycolicibacterium psychrotolerans]